jgi:hypothetical protein
MKLSSLKLLLASLAVSSFVFAGCAADETDAASGEDAEDVGVSADELTSRAQQFVGSYAWHAGDSGALVDFKQLSLKKSGLYAAKIGAQQAAESGTWSVVKSGGQLKIRVNPWGSKPSRSYFAAIQDQTRTLTLTRFGKTTTLFFEGSTCANVRCTSATHCEMSFTNGAFSPSCVPNDPPPPPATCAVTLCVPNTTCIDTPTGAECVPQVTCASVLCITGTTCVDKPTGPECVANTPAPCVKTGCSGQICADGDMASTCEFRPEYACYASATCTRQATGQCGWTQTSALSSCLASHK